MEKLKLAIERKRVEDPKFSGTSYATSKLCEGVSHQMVQNLLSGTTPPWNVRVSTMQELVSALPGLKPKDFYKARTRKQAA